MKLGLDLENCYGINKLAKELDFARIDGIDGVCSLQVPPECILSVTCGANMPDEQKQEVRETTQRLGISCLEAKPDSDEYKLNFV